MDLPALFLAVSQAMFISLGYAFCVWLFVNFASRLFPKIAAQARHNVFFSCLMLVFVGFMLSVVWLYNPALKSALLADIPTGEIENDLPAKIFIEVWLKQNSLWIAGFYITGVIVQTVILIGGYLRVGKTTGQHNPEDYAAWYACLKNLCVRLKMNRSVALFFSYSAFVPFTAGFFKPFIVFPIALINQLTPAQTEAILLHELAHIKRNDFILNMLQRAVEIVLFFNPFVWMLGNEIRKAREFCCDDLVLADNHNPNVYANALLIIEDNRHNPSLAMAATGSAKFPLLTRIKRIMDMKTIKNNRKTQILSIFFLLSVSLSLAWMLPANTTISQLQKTDTLTIPVPPSPGLAPIPPAVPAIGEFKPAVAPLAPIVPPLQTAPVFADTPKVPGPLINAEFKKQMEEMKLQAKEMKEKFNSPEFKNQMEQMKIDAEKMKKEFNSPEFKKQMEQMKLDAEKMKKEFNSPEFRRQMEQMKLDAEKMKKEFDSPEFRKQMEQMKLDAEKMKKEFSSPEFRKQMEQMKLKAEKMKKEFDSPEFKKQMKQFELETENKN